MISNKELIDFKVRFDESNCTETLALWQSKQSHDSLTIGILSEFNLKVSLRIPLIALPISILLKQQPTKLVNIYQGDNKANVEDLLFSFLKYNDYCCLEVDLLQALGLKEKQVVISPGSGLYANLNYEIIGSADFIEINGLVREK